MNEIVMSLAVLLTISSACVVVFVFLTRERARNKLKRRELSANLHIYTVAYGRWWNRLYIQCKNLDHAHSIKSRLENDHEVNVEIETAYFTN